MSFTNGFEKTAGVGSAFLAAQKAVGKGGAAVGNAASAVGGAAKGVALGTQKTVAKGVGATVAGIGKVKRGVKSALQSGKAARVSGYRAGSKGINREVGQGLSVSRSRKAAPGANLGAPEAQAKKAREDVFKRKAGMDKAKADGKPSFARKHPFVTAGALYLGTKAALGGGDQQQSDPRYIPPQ